MKLSDYPPGFAAHKYRATPEEIEESKRLLKTQAEKDAAHRRKLIEEGKIQPDERDKKPA